ncbi:MAG: M20/M25/M40 family metallo-hydrolase [Chloroflexota bacterium]
MPDPLHNFLKELIDLPGISGFEASVCQRIHAEWQPLADEISISPLGSLHALKRGSAPAPRPSLMLAAHMDAVGLMVRDLVDGWLRIVPIGVLDPRILPGQPVTVHGRKDLPGLIVLPPPHCLPEEARQGPPRIEHLLIDLGLPLGQVRRWVRPGDPVSFSGAPFQLGDDLLVGHSLDNRASVAALTHCLQLLQGRDHAWDVLLVATTQEETHLGGAWTSGFALRPSAAVAVDVTYASGLGQPEHKTFALRGGPTNGWGSDIHPGMHRALKAAAERIEIPLNVEWLPTHSGTDARALQVAAEPIPTGVVGIPLRYMHTPVEVVALAEIRRAGRLLAEFATGLQPDFLHSLTLE